MFFFVGKHLLVAVVVFYLDRMSVSTATGRKTQIGIPGQFNDIDKQDLKLDGAGVKVQILRGNPQNPIGHHDFGQMVRHLLLQLGDIDVSRFHAPKASQPNDKKDGRPDELIEGDGKDAEPSPVFNLFEILDRVLEIGRRGMRIQRFKGLGEMNAKELYSTTMDPATRKLLRVRLDDENDLEADKMFDGSDPSLKKKVDRAMAYVVELATSPAPPML